MSETTGNERYRVGMTGRWLPRCLAGSVLAAATLAAWNLDALGGSTLIRMVRPSIVAAGAFLALAVLRYGGEVRQVVQPAADRLRIAIGRRQRELPYVDIVRWSWAAPFQGSRNWLPAIEILDRYGQVWRLSGLLQDGDRMIASILTRSDRSDLEAWAETGRLSRRMRPVTVRLSIGYTVSVALLLAAWLNVSL